ncbi:MAG: fumarate hydratase C-terminal domain-containing protein [Chitinivibrionales bacterium]|nr:fumarate hydratase C-terminal domain-containing protein [Chitinivibrionales bacterium]
MNAQVITTPLLKKTCLNLHAGDDVLICGTLYTARDAAHALLVKAIDEGNDLPVDLKDQILYYTGPTPTPPAGVIGSCGPTTSRRMDAFTPKLIEQTGVRGLIGKGNRSQSVINAMKEYGCIYFAALGGGGALLAQCVKQAHVVCYHHLGPEAVYQLTVENFPCIVAIDSAGTNLYESR